MPDHLSKSLFYQGAEVRSGIVAQQDLLCFLYNRCECRRIGCLHHLQRSLANIARRIRYGSDENRFWRFLAPCGQRLNGGAARLPPLISSMQHKERERQLWRKSKERLPRSKLDIINAFLHAREQPLQHLLTQVDCTRFIGCDSPIERGKGVSGGHLYVPVVVIERGEQGLHHRRQG